MKNLVQSLLLVFLTLGIVSCNNDSVDNNEPTTQEPNNSQTLVSITKNSTWVNYLEVTNFSDGKITDIQYSDGTYHLYMYSGDKVSQINEYDASGNVLFFKTFNYDANSRLVQRTVIPNTLQTEWENYQVFSYNYNDDSIIITYKLFSFDNVQQGDEQVRNCELDQNNIVKSYGLELSVAFRDEATYLNGNPMTFTHFLSGNPTQQTTFEYSIAIAADAYFTEKFKFGNEWKNNSLLSQGQSSLDPYFLDDIGVNYLTSVNYSFNYQEQSVNGLTTYSYGFDENNLLLSQTQSNSSSADTQTYVTVITYEYE